jgi:hypothetical protein
MSGSGWISGCLARKATVSASDKILIMITLFIQRRSDISRPQRFPELAVAPQNLNPARQAKASIQERIVADADVPVAISHIFIAQKDIREF